MNVAYSEKLKDPRWQKKRLEIFERDNWTCVSCTRSDITLHIHHLKYSPGCQPWEYDNCYLVTYCEICHNTEHLIGDQVNENLIDVIRLNPVYIKPVAQISILAEKWPGFYNLLKPFLNESMITYLKTLETNKL